MKLVVNGDEREMTVSNLAELVEAQIREHELPGPEGVAIAHNGRVVRRSAWRETIVEEGDRIEIVRAMQGG